MKRKLLTLLLASSMLMALLLAGCGGAAEPAQTGEKTAGATTTNDATPDSTAADNPATDGPDSVNPYELTGTVSIGYPEGETAEISPVLDAFRLKYPNITVIDVPFPQGSTWGGFNEFLTQRAASGDMPDVMWLDWNQFAPQVASGYVMPLDDLMANDPEAAYVSDGIKDIYTYGGKLYAVPMQYNAMGINVNLDLLDELNIDKPSYDWTWDEFVEFVKSGITQTTAGAAQLGDVDVVMSGQASGKFIYGYDPQGQKYDFTGQWLPSINRVLELNAIPGLNAEAMKFPKEDGNTPINSDYVRKFGEDGKDDNHYLFKENLALICTNGTWADNWMREQCKGTWDWWPYPRLNANTPVQTPIHPDATYITSTCTDTAAAYELLKWLSFGVEGNIYRLDIFDARPPFETVDGEDKYYKVRYLPTTSHPDVVARFKQSPHVTEGFLALYESMETAIHGDLGKYLPNFDSFWNDIGAGDMLDQARRGEANAADVAAQLDDKVNAGLATAWAEFNNKIAQ
jgi:ABC-type glycerol-3-phosphate transport system substrate-binding protein